jgi:SAM-dependent methyltransferase
MKYYEVHNELYRKLLAKGQVAWDKGQYEEFEMLGLIKRFIDESDFEPSRSCVLDLGCGTGGLSCYLSSHGFKVTAVDISAVAVKEAKKQAASRGLKIDSRVADLCRDELPENAFDLIIDNHFLHCIVFPDERDAVLQSIRRALKPDGEYWIETMSGHPEMKPRDKWNLDAEGISWALIPGEVEMEGCINRNGRLLCPSRRIQPSDAIIMEELYRAGFELVWYETAPPSDENDTGWFRARCRQKISKT